MLNGGQPIPVGLAKEFAKPDYKIEFGRCVRCGAVLDIQKVELGVMFLHIQGTIERTFAKDYVERLRGYPRRPAEHDCD